jgi:outer membrane protein TolC
MKKIIISILAILVHIMMYSQNNINTVLDSIEANNTTLKALRARFDAQKLQNSTFKNLSNPEVGFNYLWGNPNEIGNRTDFSVSQTFDIATITGLKGNMVDEQNNLIEWQYKAERMNVLLEAKQYFIELIYYNALQKEMQMRLEYAQSIHKAYNERMESGDANVLEFNKVKLNLSMAEGDLSRINLERNSLLEQLKRLNGGDEIFMEESEFSILNLPVNFEEWFVKAEQKNPVLSYVKQTVEVNKKQVSINKAQNLPQFSVGYMSENVVGQRYQGITTGVSIPLWGNKNQVKQAKAKVFAAEVNVVDSKQQFYSQLQIQYNRTNALMANAEQYRKTLETANNTDLLTKALNLGQISILDYIVEIGLYYETVNRTLEAERDYQKAYAELTAVEL